MAEPFPHMEIVPWAQAGEDVYQIPASLNIAASGVESNFGKATPPGSNNWHGMKALPGQAQVSASTGEQASSGAMYTIVAGFIAFKTPAESFMYYAKLLGLGRPYHDMVTEYLASPRAPADVEALAGRLQGVYATSHTYASALVAMMVRYDLFQFDKIRRAPAPAAPPPPPPAAADPVKVYLSSPRTDADGQALIAALNKENPRMTDPSTSATSTTAATATQTLATATTPARVTPTVSQATRVDWGSWLAQFIEHEKPIIEAAAEAGISLALGAAGPLGPIVRTFIGPVLVKQYVDQGIVAAEGLINAQSLTVSDTNVVGKIVANLITQNEPQLIGFIETEIEPLIKGALAALGFPTS